jgi:shikimate dehydrogenase
MTDRYAVIGNPIDFSKSTLIHMAFAQATAQDMDYTKVLSPLGEFAATVDAFRAAGGKGMNITAPFKLDAFDYATERSPAAELAGAANAVKLEGNRVLAEQAAEAFAWWRGMRPDTQAVIAQLTIPLV